MLGDVAGRQHDEMRVWSTTSWHSSKKEFLREIERFSVFMREWYAARVKRHIHVSLPEVLI